MTSTNQPAGYAEATSSGPATAKARTPPWLAEHLLLSAIWGASFLFMRLATVELGALPTAALRVGVGALVLLPLLWLRGLQGELRRHWKTLFVVGMLNSGIPFVCFSFALLSITSGLSAILNATVPMFGAIVAWLWFRERPNASRSFGLAVGFAGVAMLAWDKASFKPDASGLSTGWAVLATLLACVCYGVAANYTRRYLSGLPTLVTASGSLLAAALGLAIPAALTWPAHAPGPTAWLAVLGVGVLCTGVAYILYFRLIEHAGPARALTVTYLLPVFAVVYGALFLHEAVTPWMLICGAVIVAGTALASGVVRLGRVKVAAS